MTALAKKRTIPLLAKTLIGGKSHSPQKQTKKGIGWEDADLACGFLVHDFLLGHCRPPILLHRRLTLARPTSSVAPVAVLSPLSALFPGLAPPVLVVVISAAVSGPALAIRLVWSLRLTVRTGIILGRGGFLLGSSRLGWVYFSAQCRNPICVAKRRRTAALASFGGNASVRTHVHNTHTHLLLLLLQRPLQIVNRRHAGLLRVHAMAPRERAALLSRSSVGAERLSGRLGNDRLLLAALLAGRGRIAVLARPIALLADRLSMTVLAAHAAALSVAVAADSRGRCVGLGGGVEALWMDGCEQRSSTALESCRELFFLCFKVS